MNTNMENNKEETVLEFSEEENVRNTHKQCERCYKHKTTKKFDKEFLCAECIEEIKGEGEN